MHRHWLHRVFTTVLVAWFTALVAEPIALHPCPMHDGVLLMSSHAAGHHMGAMDMAHEQPASHADDRAPAPAPHSTNQHQCTCLGNCTATGTTGLPSARLTLANALVTRPYDSGLPDHIYVPVAAQHVLPFAHAPPPSPRAL